jgi:hypothetical protein
LRFLPFDACLSTQAFERFVLPSGFNVQPTTFLLFVALPLLHACHIMLDKCPGVLKANHMFVSWPFEPVQVDKQTVKLNPVIDLTMNPPIRDT